MKKPIRRQKMQALLLHDITEKTDIKNAIKLFIQSNKIKSWSDYRHGHNKSVNANNKCPLYPTDMSRHQIQVFSRLRLGHTFATRQHIFKK